MKMAALAPAGPATKARNSRPSPCLRAMKLPFCAGEFLSSSTAATLRVNTTSESTKTLRNFIELLQQWIVEFPSFFASAPAQQLSKSTATGPMTSNRCTRLHGKPAHTCSSIHFICFWGFSILLHRDHDGCRVRNSSRLGGDHD